MQHLDGPFAGLDLTTILVKANHLHYLISNRVDHAESRHRLLEDHGDLAAADLADFLPAVIQLHQIDRLTVLKEGDFAGDDFAVFGHYTQDRLGGDALAAAALAGDSQRLPRVNVEGHAVNGLQDALLGEEVGSKIFYREQERWLGHWTGLQSFYIDV